MIRRMLSAVLTNNLASKFNWAGKGEKRGLKETLMQDCMFGESIENDDYVTDKAGFITVHCPPRRHSRHNMCHLTIISEDQV